MRKSVILLACSVLIASSLVIMSRRAHSQGVQALPYVHLQSTTPGNTENGNINISGTGLFGAKVGIGTTNPSNRLTVSQETDSTCVLAVNSGLTAPQFSTLRLNDRGTPYWSVSKNATNDFSIREVGSSSDRLYIAQGGFVGIGTSAPQHLLSVTGSATDYVAHVFNGDTTGNSFHAVLGGITNYPFVSTGAVFAETNARFGIGVLAAASGNSASGVFAWAPGPNSTAVDALCEGAGGKAVSGYINSGQGVGYAIYGETPQSTNFAGYFNGKVAITGTLSKGGGSFKIDHPLDPENKYLYHSFVESPDMKNIYDGVVRTDARGYATITMPDWFEALNRDFRYQLTVIDDQNTDAFVQAKVVRRITTNQFMIRTSSPGVTVSWQVTGTRHDAFANAHRIPVEEDKPDDERGLYLYPKEHGQVVERGINYQRMHKQAGSTPQISPSGY